MRLLPSSALAALVLAGGCVSQTQSTPEYGGEYQVGLSTGPGDESYAPATWSGPPGGAMDPGFGYEDPALAGSPSAQSVDGGYGGAMYGGQTYGEGWADPSATGGDPAVWASATAEVTDAEIDLTLDAYGEWVEDADYGRVWRPYNTVVGVDFTPYESCGSWVYTDYGWTFQSCEEWSWGWLPFHFGRWVFLDAGWCWTRDYTWGPGWVEWRHGGGYVGWRPMRPTRVIRDHRDRTSGPIIRDHRRGKHAEWRFVRDTEFGRGRIQPARSVTVRDGLRATTSVAQPPLRADFRRSASLVMAGRLRDHQRFDARSRGTIGQSTRGYERPSYGTGAPRDYTTAPPRGAGPTRPYTALPTRTNPAYNPTYSPGVTRNPDRPTWQAPRSYGSRPSVTTGGDRYYTPPAGGPRGAPPTRPSPTWGGPRGAAPSPSTRPSTTWGGSRPSAPPPSTRPTWGGSRGSAPAPSSRPSTNWGGSRPSSPPSRSYSAPSRSYSAPSRSSYSAPSRSSGSSSRSSGGGSHSSGGSRSGGGHRR